MQWIQSNVILFCFCRFKWHEQQYLGTFSDRPKLARYPPCPALHREHVRRGVTSQTGSGGGTQGAETLGPQLETDGSGQTPSVCVCACFTLLWRFIYVFPHDLIFHLFFWFWEIIRMITVPLRPHGSDDLLSCSHVKITYIFRLLFIRIGQVSEYKLSARL